MLGTVLWTGGKLVTKYVLVPVAVSILTAIVADAVARRMRERTAILQGGVQQRLDIDPALHPAP
jgi:ABC-type phosphate transport system ATPase subunit